MLEICGKYGEEFSVDYNPTKDSVCGFQQEKDGGKDQCEVIWDNKVKHLTNHLQDNLCKAQ